MQEEGVVPTREWEAHVELRPSENEDDELAPPTVVQEEGVVELRHDGEVFSFDCQEIPDDLDSDTRQGPQHFTTSATRSDRKRVHVGEQYIPS